MRGSIIVPCYNEEAVIGITYDRIKNVITNISGVSFEIIFINDGSTDQTLNVLNVIAQRDKNVKILNFSRNFGHQPAVSAGIQFCSGDIAIIMDADLQDPPELIPEMIAIHLNEKANVVYAVRKRRKGESVWFKLSAKVFYKFINCLSDIPLPLDSGDFRLIDKRIMKEFKALKEKRKYVRGLIAFIGYKQVPLPYERDARFAGKTKYPFLKLWALAKNSLIYFTKKPLGMAVTTGFISILIGLVFIVYIFIRKYNNSIPIPGWASTAVLIVFSGGVQLLTIGVIGEYIGSMFEEIKGRPEYIISDIIEGAEEKR